MILIKNIGELVGIVPAGVLRKQGAEMAETGVLKDAWLAIEDGKIAGFGKMADLTVGKPVGEMYTSARMKRNDDGLPVLQKATTTNNQRYWGEYQPVYELGEDKYVGNFQPSWMGGFGTSFRYKNLTLAANFDFSIGGQIVSWTNMWGIGSGILEGSANVNDKGINEREPVSKGGGVHVVGVDTEGNPVDTYINSYRWYHYKAQYDNDAWVYDRTYLKMREISIGYNVPKNVLNKLNIGLSSASICLPSSVIM